MLVNSIRRKFRLLSKRWRIASFNFPSGRPEVYNKCQGQFGRMSLLILTVRGIVSWGIMHWLAGSHEMRRIYLKTIGGRPRPDWCLLNKTLNIPSVKCENLYMLWHNVHCFKPNRNFLQAIKLLYETYTERHPDRDIVCLHQIAEASDLISHHSFTGCQPPND